VKEFEKLKNFTELLKDSEKQTNHDYESLQKEIDMMKSNDYK